MAGTAEKTAENHEFKAEVAKLLHLMVHSVYSNRDIFLRELISNASDACDKLRYAAITDPALTGGDADFQINIAIDKDAKTLTIADNGVGMGRDELVENLGTIARSGTSNFVSQLSGDAAKDVNLIGQFGVGFYSVFMVADTVAVTSRKAGGDAAFCWRSDGLGSFTVTPAEKSQRGTEIVLHLKDDAGDFLEPARLKTIIKTYSDHIAIPIRLADGGKEAETANSASALWTRAKSDITPQQYTEFYHHAAHAFDEPWHTLHYRAEGTLEYNVLLFIPSQRPFDLFDPARKSRVKLYVKRVFITDECGELLPGWLRFVRGVVDSQDLPLNLSREMLQHNPVLAKMRKAIVNKIVSELEKRSEDADGYAKFWDVFGAVLKEGLYEDFDHRDALLKLARFRSTNGDGLASLAEYAGRMKDGQSAIYYITADTVEAARRSPQIEGFAARGIEVLLLTDPIDDFWLSSVPEYDGKPLQSVTQAGDDLDKIAKTAPETDEPPVHEAELATLIAALKQILGEAVKDVRASKRLTGSAVCLVADSGDMDIHLQRMLKLHNQLNADTPRVLEINPSHALVRALAARAAQPGAVDALDDSAHLLLDQARLLQGEAPADPAAFARRLSAAMEKGLA